MEPENQIFNVKRKGTSAKARGRNIEVDIWGGSARSSEEVSVMGMERRG
jgi:hypothetical protein